MKNIIILGAVLIVLGIAGLVFDSFSYTETEPVLTAGPIKVTTEEHHYVTIPNVVSVIVLLTGIALVFGGRRPE